MQKGDLPQNWIGGEEIWLPVCVDIERIKEDHLSDVLYLYLPYLWCGVKSGSEFSFFCSRGFQRERRHFERQDPSKIRFSAELFDQIRNPI